MWSNLNAEYPCVEYPCAEYLCIELFLSDCNYKHIFFSCVYLLCAIPSCIYSITSNFEKSTINILLEISCKSFYIVTHVVFPCIICSFGERQNALQPHNLCGDLFPKPDVMFHKEKRRTVFQEQLLNLHPGEHVDVVERLIPDIEVGGRK